MRHCRNLKKLAFIFLSATATAGCRPAENQQVQATTNLGSQGCTPQQLERRAADSRQATSNKTSVTSVAFNRGGPSSATENIALTENGTYASPKESDPCASALSISSSQSPIADGLVTIDWKCSGRRRMTSGGLKQDEYCEWERVSRKSGETLACTFTTSFDHSRKYFLTSREKNYLWQDTQFNSYAYLAGGREINPAVTRRGIINHCLKRACGAGDIEKPDYFGNCVASRASDPEICSLVNQAVIKYGCSIEVPTSRIYTARSASLRQAEIEGDREIKLFLRPTGLVRTHCRHVVDPSFGTTQPFDPQNEGTLLQCDIPTSEQSLKSCDDVADYIQVVASLKLSGCKK